MEAPESHLYGPAGPALLAQRGRRDGLARAQPLVVVAVQPAQLSSTALTDGADPSEAPSGRSILARWLRVTSG